jgi:hypothetical protein
LFQREYPEQASTGNRGYFTNAGFVFDSSQSQNSELRADSIRRACVHVAQSPTCGSSFSLSFRLTPPE